MSIISARLMYRLGVINHRFEFLVILTWMLFFPDKDSFLYFLSTAVLVIFFSIRNIYFMKTAGVSYFNYALVLVALMFIFSLFFSYHQRKSLFFVSDLLLILSYFLLFYNDRRKEAGHYMILTYIISVFSLVKIISFIFPRLFMLHGQKYTFFANSIHEGIISGLAVLILFYYYLKNEREKHPGIVLALIVLNGGGVFVSQSKAAYLGVVIFTALMLFMKRKRWIPFMLLFVVLTFIIPNPIRAMVFHSLKADPYSLNRLDIWQMCGRIVVDHPLVGVGMDNFAEVSGKYNFKQTYGPANYYKVSRETHNDYLQLITETGIAGIVLLSVLFYFLIRKIFAGALFNIAKILLLYLLFQAFLFNILFTTFFFFILIFLLKNLLEGETIFKSFPRHYKFSLISLLVMVFVASYFLPWVAEGYVRSARQAANPLVGYNLLNKASYLDPLNTDVYYLKATTLYHYFKQSTNLEAFYSAVDHLKTARRLRPYFIDSYLLETELYLDLMQKNIKYPAMETEIMALLETAEKYAPHNPFLKLTRAKVYLDFGQKEQAKTQALKALELEPEYVEALYFLHSYFNFFGEDTAFNNKINAIQKKARDWQVQPGQYLYKLFSLPVTANGVTSPRSN